MQLLQQKFRVSSLGNLTLQNIGNLRRLVLIRLQDEADWRPFKIKLRMSFCQPAEVFGEGQQHLQHLLLKQLMPQGHISQLDRSSCISSQHFMELNYVVSYCSFLSVFQCFTQELLEMGWPSQLPFNKDHLSRLVDLLLPLVRERLPNYETIRSNVAALKKEWRVFKQLCVRQESPWLQYLCQRTLMFTVLLNRTAFYAENLDITQRISKASTTLSPEALAKKINRVFCRIQFVRWIRQYVERKQHENEICLNCEKAFPSNRLTKHIKVCKQIYDLGEYTESIDAEVSAKLQDLKQYVMDVRKLQLEKEKEREREKQRELQEAKARAANAKKPFFKKGLSKTVVSHVRRSEYNEFDDNDTAEKSSNSNSDSECSEASGKATKGPARKIAQLSVEELISYLWVLDQMKTVGNKIRQQRESTNIELLQELKNFKSTVEPKFRQLNVMSEEAECIMRLLVDRIECIEKERKLRRQLRKDGEGEVDVESFCSEFENFRSNKTMKNQRSLYKTQLQNYEESFFSEQESSVRMSEPDTSNCVRVKDFRKIRMLGRGKYGEVWEVRKKQTKVRYAMKIVYIEDSENYTQMQDLQAECNVFSVVDSPFLVKAVYSFPEGNHHYFVMEYMPNGDFADLLQRESRLYEEESKLYLAEVVLAIEALHKYGIIHRDIKPQNIVIDSQGHVKITDYGLSEAGLVKRKQDEQKNKTLSKFILKEMKKKEKQEVLDSERIVGSPYYMAPEVLSGAGSTSMSDWWSFGILVYHTLLGVPPFTGNNLDEIKEKVFRLQPWPACVKFGEGEDTISYEAKDLIDHLLKLDPQRRLGTDIEDIKQHPFFEDIDWEHLRDQQAPVSFECQDRSVDDEDYLTDDDIKESHCGSVNPCTKLIRRDVLKSQTQEKHMKGQERSSRLLAFADKLMKTCRIA